MLDCICSVFQVVRTALQVVSILSTSEGALDADDKDLSSSQPTTDHKGTETSSSGSKASGSTKSQLSRFGSKSSVLSAKPSGGGTTAAGEGGGGEGEGTRLNKYFRTFLVELLRMFETDRSLLDTKGSFVIRSVTTP